MDAAFFGVTPKQANVMDPQLRLLLEVAYEAILDSGRYFCTITLAILFVLFVRVECNQDSLERGFCTTAFLSVCESPFRAVPSTLN